MVRYLVRTLLGIVPTLLLLLLIVSLLTKLVPGDAVDSMVSQMGGDSGSTAAQRERLREELGLTRSIPEQYVAFLRDIGSGTMGHSLYSSKTVWSLISSRALPTIELAVLALLVSTALGILTGVVSSVRRNSKLDYLMRLFVLIFLSVPNFVIAVCVVLLPAFYWGWSPPLQYVPIYADPIRNLLFFATPVTALAIGLAASVARLTRTSTLEVINMDYVRTAYAKGLDERTIIYRHVLKNSLMPVLTLIGLQVGFLLSGSIILEQVFSIPGLGTLLIGSINQRDWPVVQGLTLISGVVVISASLTVELLYGWFDPRLGTR